MRDAVAEAEDDDRRGQRWQRAGIALMNSRNGSSVRLTGRAMDPIRSPSAMPDRGGDGKSRPRASSGSLPASKRNSEVRPDVPRTLGYLARRRHEKRRFSARRPQFPDAEGGEKDEHAEHWSGQTTRRGRSRLRRSLLARPEERPALEGRAVPRSRDSRPVPREPPRRTAPEAGSLSAGAPCTSQPR